MTQIVRIFDFETEKVSEIPAAELAPGMVRAKLPDIGEVFVSAEQLRRVVQTERKPLPEGFASVARAVWQLLEKRLSSWAGSQTEWIAEFEKEGHPARELLLWMRLGMVYAAMTHDQTDSEEVCHEVYRVLVSAMNNREHALETVELRRLSRARARKIVERFGALTAEEMLQFWGDRVDLDLLERLLSDTVE